MDNFSNKLILVTGGSSGIGYATIKEFIQRGATVVTCGRSHSKLEKVKQNFPDLITIQADISKVSEIDKLYSLTQKYGKIDVLVCNVGGGDKCLVDDVDEKTFDDIINKNYKSIYFSVQKSIKHLNDRASIILVSSIMGTGSAIYGSSLYSSTKAAINMLNKCFAADLIKRNIRVNTVSPGFTDTAFFDGVKKLEPNYIERVAKKIPLQRFAQPDEIAKAILFLGSSRSEYIIGENIVIDGGFNSIKTWE